MLPLAPVQLPVLLAVVFAAITQASASASASAADPLPHIVIIVADDLGFNEMGFNNASRGLLTTNLDKLAAQGVVLKHYYTNPLCSPSRSALMTGMYNHRLGLQSNVLYWDTPWAVPDHPFLPQLLKPLGYHNVMAGKWHLGMYKQQYMPMQRGFDEYNGYLQGCGSYYTHVSACCDAPANATDAVKYVCPPTKPDDYRGFDWFAGNQPDTSTNQTASSVLIGNAAVKAIEAQDPSSPLFLYLPFQNIHAPYDCSPESKAMFDSLKVSNDQKVMFGYIYEMDVAVGRVINALETKGMMKNSIILFISDNGAPEAPNVEYRNYPLRGYKAQVWEGGTRVPSFIVAPGHLPSGTTAHNMIHVSDWLPTLLTQLGAADSIPPGINGVNVWPSLVSDKPVRTEVPVNINPLCDAGQFGNPKAALRVGDMKIICWCYSVAGIANGTQSGCHPNPKDPPGTWPMLFNLTADPSETNNLAKQQPQVVASLLNRLAEISAESVEPMQWDPPYQGEGYACAHCPKHPYPGDPAEPWLPWL